MKKEEPQDVALNKEQLVELRELMTFIPEIQNKLKELNLIKGHSQNLNKLQNDLQSKLQHNEELLKNGGEPTPKKDSVIFGKHIYNKE